MFYWLIRCKHEWRTNITSALTKSNVGCVSKVHKRYSDVRATTSLYNICNKCFHHLGTVLENLLYWLFLGTKTGIFLQQKTEIWWALTIFNSKCFALNFFKIIVRFTYEVTNKIALFQNKIWFIKRTNI